MIVDTSALLAFFDAREPRHADVAGVLGDPSEPLVVSAYVVAEVDYLVATRHGVVNELAVLAELTGGAWDLACLTTQDVDAARAVIERHADLRIGLADASNVVLADRRRTNRIATLDRRHFGVLRALNGRAFEILP